MLREDSNAGTQFDYFSAESVAQAVREQREKCFVLHEEWKKAHREMVEASNQVEFLNQAKRNAEEKHSELRHRLRELCEQQAMEMTS